MTPAERTRAIVEAVAAAEGVPIALVIGPNRDAEGIRARELAALVLHSLTGATHRTIGAALRRERSSISTMLRRAEARVLADEAFGNCAYHLIHTLQKELG